MTLKTCKHLEALSRMPSVWINALRSTMADHSVPDTMLPLNTMTATMLEYMALAPHRFVSMLNGHNGGCIQPTSVRVLPRITLQESRQDQISDAGTFEGSLCTYGGQYLVSLYLHEHIEGTLFSLWDLGFTGRDAISPLAHFVERSVTSDLILCLVITDPRKPQASYVISIANPSHEA